jgi:hypothetical protein
MKYENFAIFSDKEKKMISVIARRGEIPSLCSEQAWQSLRIKVSFL